jgi:hypothetical protein
MARATSWRDRASLAFVVPKIPNWAAAIVIAALRVRRRRANVSRRPPDHALSQRLERRAQLRREECRFFPGREVSAAVDLVEVGEAGVDRLDPAARGSPDLPGECRECHRNRHRRRSLARRSSRGQKLSELPVPSGRRSAGARQPVQRDVVDDGLPGEIAHGLAVDERTGNLVVAVRVMVEQPGREPHG